MREFLHKQWQSLIFRLLLYFVIAMLVLVIIVAGSFAKRLKPHFEHEVLPNVERYIEYLIDDIGNPPDTRVAKQLADKLPFELGIFGPDLNWTSSALVRPVDVYDLKPAPPPYNNVYIGHHRHDEILLVQRGGYQYLFALDNNFQERAERRHWTLLLMLGGTLFILYLAIRRLFRPITAISTQVNKIARGDLEQSIRNSGTGELSRLADGVNRMTAQIKSMLESKSGLLLAISHELRSPLTRMRVNLELLEASDTQKKLIDDVHEMEDLIAAILESEKLNSQHAPLNLECFELASLIEDMVHSHPCHGRIETSLSPVTVVADKLRISLMLKNIIDNAGRYSEPDSPIEICLTHDSELVRITVTDHGTGIDEKVLPRLTEAFYRPHSARQRETGGYGLGLYLCRLIIEAHDGRLNIESSLGQGTVVMVTFPLRNS